MFVYNFAILALGGSTLPITMPWPMAIFGTQVCQYVWAPSGLPLYPTPNNESHLQATMEKYAWGSFQFWLILRDAKTPLFGTPISAHGVVNWRPHIFLPMTIPDLTPKHALRYEP